MAIYSNISSKAIIRKVMRDLKPNTADWIDDAIEWIGEALEHIGTAAQMEKKQCVLQVKDYRTKLPSDLYYINQVAVNYAATPAMRNALYEVTSRIDELKLMIAQYNQQLEVEVANTISEELLKKYDTQYKSNVNELRDINNQLAVLEQAYFTTGSDLTPLSYGASTFPGGIHAENCVNEIARSKESYVVDNGFIKTTFPVGELCISYMAFPIDEDCYPMVPNSISFKEAMFWYVFKQMLLGGYDKPTNKIDYNYADQKWRFYCGQAEAEAKYPDIDKAESFMNQWVRLIPDLNQHAVFFETLNDREQLNRE